FLLEVRQQKYYIMKACCKIRCIFSIFKKRNPFSFSTFVLFKDSGLFTMSIALFPLSFYNICILFNFALPFHSFLSFIHFYLSFISIFHSFLSGGTFYG